MNNISLVTNQKTARTCLDAALARAEHLAIYGCKSILELCVGPSLKTLETTYAKHDMQVTGNDIEARWRNYYPLGKWVIGDALAIDYSKWDTIVFAPPLSKGCTGTRADALMIDQVFPKYTDFIKAISNSTVNLAVLVLPGRSLATAEDRKQLFKLLSVLSNNNFKYDLVELKTKKRNLTKYIDVYFYR